VLVADCCDTALVDASADIVLTAFRLNMDEEVCKSVRLQKVEKGTCKNNDMSQRHTLRLVKRV